MDRLLIWTIRLISLLSLVILLVSNLNRSAANSAPQAIFTDSCAAPCWHHIYPGTTTLSQAERQFGQDKTARKIQSADTGLCWLSGFWRVCLNHADLAQIVTDIDFYPLATTRFQLGDALQSLGQPIASANACLFEDGDLSELTALVLFDNHVQLSVTAPTSNAEFHLTPSMKVTTIIYNATADPLSRYSAIWHGFSRMTNSAGNCE